MLSGPTELQPSRRLLRKPRKRASTVPGFKIKP